MSALPRVERQAEIGHPREPLFELVATSAGLRRWLDEAELDARVGAAVRLRLKDAVALGNVLSISAPQHISLSWDWEGAPLGVPTVVAFDLIDHGQRTHLTLRHVGLPRAQLPLHEALWEYWFGRLVAAAESLGATTTGAGSA